MSTTTSLSVEALIEEFRPTSCGETPWDAQDQCHRESTRFVRLLREHGHEAGTVSGYRFTTFQGQRVVEAGHTAVMLGDGTVIDWTARQFWGGRWPSDDAPAWPVVTTASEWRAEWESLSL